jgi:hypothetical protein
MSELSTVGLAHPGDARAIAEMSRDLIEQGLTWAWTPARVQHFISGADSSVIVARRGDDRRSYAWLSHPNIAVRDWGASSWIG